MQRSQKRQRAEVAGSLPEPKRQREKAVKHSSSVWDAQKANIKRIFLVEDETLDVVRQHMRDHHGFSASKTQYEKQIREWGWRKTLKPDDWKYVDRKLVKRAHSNKESAVYLNTIRVAPEKLKKRLIYNTTLTEKYQPRSAQKQCPIGVYIATPPPSGSDDIRTDNLPCVGLVDLKPKVLRDLLPWFQNDQSEGIILDEPSPSWPSYGLVEDEGAEELRSTFPSSDIVIAGGHSSNTTRLNSSAEIVFIPRIPDSVERLYHSLPKDYSAFFSVQIYHQRSAIATHGEHASLLKFILYACSNKFESCDFKDWISGFLSISLFDALSSSRLPSIKACLEYLVSIALERGNDELYRALLSRKVTREIARSSPAFEYCLRRSLSNDNPEVVQSIVESIGNSNKQWQPSFVRSVRVVEILEQSGVDFSWDTIGGWIDVGRWDAAKHFILKAPDAVSGHIGTKLLGSAINYIFKSWHSDESELQKCDGIVEALLEAGAKADCLVDMQRGFHKPLRMSLIQVASHQGRKNLVRILLERKADVNAHAHECGYSALWGGVKSGDVELVQMILDAGAWHDYPVNNSQYRPQKSLMMMAVESKDAEMVRLLHEVGVHMDHDELDELGRSTLEVAALQNDPEIINLLFWTQRRECMISSQAVKLSLMLDSVVRKDYVRWKALLAGKLDFTKNSELWSSILCEVIDCQEEQSLKDLVDIGLDLNTWYRPTCDTRAISPLGYAVQAGDRSLVSLLLEAKANPNFGMTSIHGYPLSPLSLAIMDGGPKQNEIVDLLLEKGANHSGQRVILCGHPTTLLGSTSGGHCVNFDIACTLLKYGADVNENEPEIYPALHMAARRGNKEMVELLLEHGANVNMLATIDGHSRKYTTALHAAVARSVGAKDYDVNATGDYAQSALQAAAMGEPGAATYELCKLLIDSGADTNALDDYEPGITALQGASRRGNLRVVQMLLEHGADVNVCSVGREMTALEYAADYGRLDIVQFLINARADTHLPGSSRYRSAEEYARRRGHHAVADFLKGQFEESEDGGDPKGFYVAKLDHQLDLRYDTDEDYLAMLDHQLDLWYNTDEDYVSDTEDAYVFN